MSKTYARYRILIEAMRTGSLTKVAEKTGYTQSGISHILNTLEKEWGITLLLRNHNGSVLTSEGEHLLPYIHESMRAEEMLHEQIEALKGLEAGLIRVASFSSVSQTLLPHVIRSYQKQYPSIKFEILHGDYSDIESWIKEGSADVGFLRLPLGNSFDYRPFYHDKILAILPENHSAKDQPYISTKDLEESPFVMVDMGATNDFERYFEAHNIKPNIRYTTREDAVVMAMVESELGISLAYELALKRNPYRIIAKELEIPVERQIVTATKKGQHNSLAVESFLAFLKDYHE